MSHSTLLERIHLIQKRVLGGILVKICHRFELKIWNILLLHRKHVKNFQHFMGTLRIFWITSDREYLDSCLFITSRILWRVSHWVVLIIDRVQVLFWLPCVWRSALLLLTHLVLAIEARIE